MSHRFDISTTHVLCNGEQLNEWGKDEMHLIGFGVGRKGHLFATGYRSLGSYHTGDVRSGAQLAPPLFGAELPDDGLEVIFYFWLIEEDGGGVKNAAAALETQFRDAFRDEAARLTEVQFPRECIPFTAFYKVLPGVQRSLDEASTDGRNDEVYAPVDLLLRPGTDGPSALSSSTDWTIRRSKNLGDYNVTFRFTYHWNPVVLGSGPVRPPVVP